MKLKQITLPILAVLMAFCATAQDREAGLFLGTALYQGDLSKRQVTLSETKWGLGIFGRYYFNPRWDIKGNFYYGRVSGDDANYGDVNDFSSEDRYRARRNLSFRSDIFELSTQLEFNILPFISNSRRYRFAPYLFGGVALYHFNPKAELNGTVYALQPLGTEGQHLNNPDYPNPYSRLQGAIPYGFGIKYSLGKFWNLGIEIGQRKLFTDYLDDVSGSYPDLETLRAQPNNGNTAAALSYRTPEVWPTAVGAKEGGQRGDPKDLDMYIFAGFTISKTFRKFPCTDF